ncbi:MAG TPA: DUF697 domain-containing protein [Sandaracinaceae bacterium LLY-WYZ-13_1]|nr:DUF697 domain-containing protein [Sandaracinaceae bacterium LLY-WYZ-13_1]
MQDTLFGPPRDERDRRCRKLIERCGYTTAALTLLPIPGSEIVGVMPVHVGMVIGIGDEYGQRLTRESATELLMKIGATVGLSLVGSKLATTAGKILLPGLGGLVAAPFMFASTIGLGTVARLYFESEGELSDAQMRDVFRRAKDKAKDAFDPRRARSSEAKEAAREAVREGEVEGEDAGAPAKGKASVDDLAERLATLEELHDKGLISDRELERRREAILNEV